MLGCYEMGRIKNLSRFPNISILYHDVIGKSIGLWVGCERSNVMVSGVMLCYCVMEKSENVTWNVTMQNGLTMRVWDML